MLNLKNKKFKICIIGMLISLAIFVIVFYATDDLIGNKEFSEYTHDDWSIAMLPLSIIIVSGVFTLIFALIIIVPLIWRYPAIMDYVANEKFSDIDSDTDFLVFDHNEFKRACCRTEMQNGLMFSIKEYNLKTKVWTILEEGRYIENAEDLICILQEDYQYDKAKVYYRQNCQHTNNNEN